VSVQASSWVWENSEAKGNARLVLLAIADAADAQGDNAWPKQETIARMVRVDVRTVRRLVDDLIELGELQMIRHGGGTTFTRSDRRPHLYRLPKMAGQNGRTSVSGRCETGGNPASHGRTFPPPRADTVVPRTSFPEHPSKTPSGGDGASLPLAEIENDLAQEDPVPQEALFDVPRPPKPPRPQSAGDVVAAYVVSYREHHADREPLKADKGRVGRDAAQILNSGQATVAELLVAAATLGTTQWANLGQQLKFERDGSGTRGPRPGRAPGMAPALPNEAPVWDELAETHRFDGLDADLERAFLERMTDV
jgi:hypothetical protein